MKILLAIALMLVSALMPQQTITASFPISTGGPVAPTFVAYAYVIDSGSGAIASITSATTLTVTTGDLIAVNCSSFNSGTTSIVASATGVTFTSVFNTPDGTGVINMGSVGVVTSGGTISVKCTPNISGQFQFMTALQYHPGTSTGVVDTGSFGEHKTPGSTTYTTSAFTTTQRTLNVLCTSNTTLVTMTAGTIGGNAATLRGVANSTLGSLAGSGCEDFSSSASMSSVTGSISFSASQSSILGSVIAIKY